MRLHLGCGKRHIPGWVNIDQFPYPGVDMVCDITRLEIPDASVDMIYACHVLEYYDWQEASEVVLPEWRRVLVPGGILRLAVPDIQSLIAIYNTMGTTLKDIIGPLYGRIEYNGKKIYHKCVYDGITLQGLLHDTGFSDVKLWDWRKTEHAKIDDCSQAYFPHMEKDYGIHVSLNVEAVK